MADNSDASADLLHQLDSHHDIPCSCRLHGNGTEHVCASQAGVLFYLVFYILVNCRTWSATCWLYGTPRTCLVWLNEQKFK